MIYNTIKKLATYALEKGLITEEERAYSINLLLDVLNLDEYDEPSEEYVNVDLESTLKEILDYAASNNLLENDSIVYRDLFDTKVMNCFTPRPQSVIDKFYSLFEDSPKEATDWYYAFAKNTDYVRDYRIKKDLKWTSPTIYGDLDITINLSKPEKDPKAIAAAKLMKQSSYPKCMLCVENEGYRGRVNHPARETIRTIPLDLEGDKFYFQYSPYSYYNEHCIVFNEKHIPMVINEPALKHLFAFVSKFPHYMLGSNADLPIVGGSILNHEHFQGGEHILPVMEADVKKEFKLTKYKNTRLFKLDWYNTTLLIRGKDPKEVVSLASDILNAWRKYDDVENEIIANDESGKHNTITPSIRKINGEYYLYLILRNNRCNEKYPDGIFHAHPEHHHIKKEGIGIIEAMGLFILPARLVRQENEIKDVLALGLNNDEVVKKYPDLARFLSMIEVLRENYSASTIDESIKVYIEDTCKDILRNTAVFKDDQKGNDGLDKFIGGLNL